MEILKGVGFVEVCFSTQWTVPEKFYPPSIVVVMFCTPEVSGCQLAASLPPPPPPNKTNPDREEVCSERWISRGPVDFIRKKS